MGLLRSCPGRLWPGAPGVVPHAQGSELQLDWLSQRWGSSTSPLPQGPQGGLEDKGQEKESQLIGTFSPPPISF